MHDIKQIFKHDYPLEQGIYNCLPKEVRKSKIKSVEMDTYSVRADGFCGERMLNLPENENKIIEPLRGFKKPSVFLELGGGDGRFALRLMKEGYTVIESDIALGSVKKVKEVAEKHGLQNGIYAIIDAENLPFKDEFLEAVFMVASLHHLPSPEKALAEINRVLKPGGKVLILREPASWQYYIFFPLYYVLRKIIRRKNRRPISLADDATFGFSRRKIKKLLEPHFKDVRIKPVHYLGKFYANYLILKKKLSGKEAAENKKFLDWFMRTDKIIAKIPLFKNLSWDWDVYGERR